MTQHSNCGDWVLNGPRKGLLDNLGGLGRTRGRKVKPKEPLVSHQEEMGTVGESQGPETTWPEGELYQMWGVAGREGGAAVWEVVGVEGPGLRE